MLQKMAVLIFSLKRNDFVPVKIKQTYNKMSNLTLYRLNGDKEEEEVIRYASLLFASILYLVFLTTICHIYVTAE